MVSTVLILKCLLQITNSLKDHAQPAYRVGVLSNGNTQTVYAMTQSSVVNENTADMAHFTKMVSNTARVPDDSYIK